MACKTPKVGAIGVQFQGQVVDQDGNPVSLAAATLPKMHLKNPVTLVTTAYDATISNVGDDWFLSYTTTTAEILPVAGLWEWEGSVAGAGGYTGRTLPQTTKVVANL